MSIRMFGLAVLTGLALGGCQSMPGGDSDVISQTLARSAAASEAKGEYQIAARQYQTLLDRQPDDRAARLGLARNLRYTGNAKIALWQGGTQPAPDLGSKANLTEVPSKQLQASKRGESFMVITKRQICVDALGQI